jgi:hypothetical protein
MKLNLRSFLITAFVLVLTTGAGVLYAQQEALEVEFPIPELGNCGSESECRVYCDDASNIDACLLWAEGHGIDIKDSSDVPPEGGPGGCISEDECRAYCDEPSHFGECVAYAEEHGHITAEEARELRDKLSRAEENDGRRGPGGCDSHRSCATYCSNPSNTIECIEFAVGEGHMSQEQANRILQSLSGDIPRIRRPHVMVPGVDVGVDPEHNIDVAKVQLLLQEENGPGGCSSFAECETYCNNPANDNECFDYAVEHDLIPTAQIEEIKRLQNVVGPGGCQGRECEAYCDAAGHENECLEFAHEQGFIDSEQYSHMKKFVDLEGPGGCRARECQAYCEDLAHQQECFAFARENGLLSAEEVASIEKIHSRLESGGGPGSCTSEVERRHYCSDPSHLDECSAFAVDAGLIPPDQAEQLLQEFINVEHFGPEGFSDGPGGLGPSAGFGGPGDFNIHSLPPEYQAEVQQRLQQFEQYRDQFESNGTSLEFQQQFDQHPPEDYDTSQFDSFRPSGGGSSLSVRLIEDPFQNNYDLTIATSAGIQKFVLSSVRGVPYSGGLDCPSIYETTIIPQRSDFPIKVTVETCNGETLTATIASPFEEPSQTTTPEEVYSASEGTFSSPDGIYPSPDEYFPDGQIPEGFEEQFQSQVEEQYQQQFELEIQRQYEEQQRQQYEDIYQQQYNQIAPDGFDPSQYPTSDGPLPDSSTDASKTGASPFQIFLDLFGL